MTTYSIPVNDNINEKVQTAIHQGFASSIADFGRKAMEKYLEDLAVKMVLDASEEPSLSGDLDDLAKKL